MDPANENTVHIGLSSWIIQDGNYPDFRQGEERSFAVEFNVKAAVETKSPTQGLIQYIEGSQYHAIGRVVHRDKSVWVVDFGFRAFCEGRPPRNAVTGRLLEGDYQLGVDPYFYFECLHARPNVPPLIYDWRIRQILIETAPFIESRMLDGRRLLARDPAQRGLREIHETDAWNDDDGDADYTLVCELFNKPPRSRR